MRITESSLRKIVKEEISLQLLREATESGKITVGELKAAIKYAEGKNKAQARLEAAKAGATEGTLAALQMIPVIGTGFSAFGVLKSIYTTFSREKKPKAKTQNPLWDILTIDEMTSALLDDAVEKEFIKDLDELISRLDDDDEIPDADKQLQAWLRHNYKRNIVQVS